MHNCAKTARLVMGADSLIDDLTDEATPPRHTATALSRGLPNDIFCLLALYIEVGNYRFHINRTLPQLTTVSVSTFP